MRVLLSLLTAGVVAVAAFPTSARAQVTGSAQCVGGLIGCSQVDFFFTSAAGSQSIDFFTLTLNTPGWEFVSPLAYVESEDAFGFNFFTPLTATPTELSGEFPFLAFLDPTLRFRAEMDIFESSATEIGFSFAGSVNGNTVFAGTVTPSTTGVVPEPMSMVLLGTGLVGIGVVARRRRRREDETV